MTDLTAIILCGGKGERLRPFTQSLPKPLVPLNGHPLLFYLLRYLEAAGIHRSVLCVGYKAETIEEFLRQHQQPAWEIHCVNSGDAAMSDRILDARRHVSGPALICYGDTIANVDLVALQNEHRQSGALATLTVYPMHSPFGVVDLDPTGRVTTIREKPVLPHWINIGFMFCEPASFAHLSPGTDLPSFASTLAAAGKLHAFRHTGKHVTVNTEKERSQAEHELVEFFTHMDNQRI